MDQSSAVDSPSSLIDSSKASSAHSFNFEVVEQLRRRVRELESKNTELSRAMPYMKDAKGDDCTKWAIDISNELEDQKTKYRESQNKLAALSHQFRGFRENTERHTRQSEKTIAEYKQKAEALEEETHRLRDRLRDEQSIIYHLQHRDSDYPQEQQQSQEEDGRRSRSAENFEECLRQIDERSESRQSTARSPPHPDSGRGEQPSLEGITITLFDKLRSTADFFMQMLTRIGKDAERDQDTEMIERIKNMKLDLNRSIEAYHKRIEEYQRRSAPSSTAPSSAETSFRGDRADAQHQCSRCKSVESERDTLRAQLNRELGLKDELMAGNEELERNLREMGRQLEEMSSQLEQSQRRAEELKQQLQKSEQYYQNRYESKVGVETAELNDKLRVLRQRYMELETRNEELVRAMRRFKQVSQEEATNKDVELQRHLVQLERLENGQIQLKESARELEDRCRQLEDQCQELERRLHEEKEANSALEAERRTHATEMRKMTKKLENIRQLLAQYSQYFDDAIVYERLVAESADVLENKLKMAEK